MNTIVLKIGMATVAASLCVGLASAGELNPIIVETKPIIEKSLIGRSDIGAPIYEMTLDMPVSAAGLDLGSYIGEKAMEQRVKNAASEACSELAAEDPFSDTNDDDCIRTAEKPALSEVRKIAVLQSFTSSGD